MIVRGFDRAGALAVALIVTGALIVACSGSGGGGAVPPETQAQTHVDYLAAPEHSFDIPSSDVPIFFRRAIERTHPDQVKALLGLGPAAGRKLTEQFTGTVAWYQDPSLCAFAYLLERLDHRDAVPVLASWLETNLLGDVLEAPSCVTHAIKVLSRQTDLSPTYCYLLSEVEDTLARVGHPISLQSHPDPAQAARVQRTRLASALHDAGAGGLCVRTFTATDPTWEAPVIQWEGRSYTKDLQALGIPGQIMIDHTTGGDAPYLGAGYTQVTGDPADKTNGEPSRFRNCGGDAVERVFHATGTAAPTDWVMTDVAGARTLAEHYGEEISNLNGEDPRNLIGWVDEGGDVKHVFSFVDRGGLRVRSKDWYGRTLESPVLPTFSSGDGLAVTWIPLSDGLHKRYPSGTLHVYRLNRRPVITDPPLCTAPCQVMGCPTGQVCLDDGTCLPQPCSVTGCPTGQVCRTDGTCAVDPRGVHYGPFSVKSDAWYPSGASVKQGDVVEVDATGYFVATSDGTTHIGPYGGGYWGWWELVAQVGSWRTYAPGGTFVAGATGALEFGVPRAIQSTYFVPEDIALLSGALSVELWVRSP